MTSAIPQYHERRMTLTETANAIAELIGGPQVVDIGQTIRIMLADYFYGDLIAVPNMSHTVQDRTIVFPPGRGYTLSGPDLDMAIEMLGEIFWAMADGISNSVLLVNAGYSHKPNECFYKFYPETLQLVIYTPVLEGLILFNAPVPLDGRAVILACQDTLPSWLQKSASPSQG